MRSGRDFWSEAAILVVTGVSFLGLIWAGVFFWRNGGIAGENALARLSGEVAEAVAVEWGHIRRDGSLFEGELQVWTVSQGPEPAPSYSWPAEPQNLVVEALLSEAQRLRTLPGGSEQALEMLLGLLEKSPTKKQLATARLQIIQLAAQQSDAAVVRGTLEEVRAELRGLETLDGSSVLLLASLAAAPMLDPAERLELRGDLVKLWLDAWLALPEQTLEGSRIRGAFANSLQELAVGEPADPRLVLAERQEHARLLQVALGKPLPAPIGNTLMVQEVKGKELLYRGLGADSSRGASNDWGRARLPSSRGAWTPKSFRRTSFSAWGRTTVLRKGRSFGIGRTSINSRVAFASPTRTQPSSPPRWWGVKEC